MDAPAGVRTGEPPQRRIASALKNHFSAPRTRSRGNEHSKRSLRSQFAVWLPLRVFEGSQGKLALINGFFPLLKTDLRLIGTFTGLLRDAKLDVNLY